MAGEGKPAAVRELQRSLSAAQEAQIVRAVALVDSLADRREADALIAQLRPRLAQVRPARPLRFPRLLFLPLDPLIVPPYGWHPGDAAIPRSGLTVLAALVREAAPAIAQTVEARIAGRDTRDAAAIAEAGALLWPAASAALLAVERPAAWLETGLPAAAFEPVARGAGGALAHATALQRIADDLRHGFPLREPALEAIIVRAAEQGGPGWAMTVALLLARLPDVAAVIRLLARTPIADTPPRRAEAERSIDGMLDRLETRDLASDASWEGDLGEMAAQAGQLGAMLDGIEGASVLPARRKRAQAIRAMLDRRCRRSFERGVHEALLAPLQREDGAAVDVAALEHAARGLRKLEMAARRASNAAFYDSALRAAAARAAELGNKAGLALADRVRLVELLAGFEAAMALFDERV